ncbi:MAG: phosphohydrolase [Bacteroidia bacterium]|nr:MAG: phosphohydrolase [Bacteroidia bacterium]
MPKKKIINDPVFGLINISTDIIFRIIEHPYFQRLRRINQLGLTDLIYPGAKHSRFQHALGATHLMSNAIEVLRSKGHAITDSEAEGVQLAILLHDIGHGPFSHTLEYSFFDNINHEIVSEAFMIALNKQFDGKLSMGIEIFKDQYKKRFLHQLVSSQLDMDRLDYLSRDSFFTGVSEGVIGLDRIIKMLNIVDDELVVDEKGIYSIEKFLIARRLMYWQVYLHKTVVAAEGMLVKILDRAKKLALQGRQLEASRALHFFLSNNITEKDLFDSVAKNVNTTILDKFASLDDSDVVYSIKTWTQHSDQLLSFLCKRLINRDLFAIEVQNKPFEAAYMKKIEAKALKLYPFFGTAPNYLVFSDSIINNAYSVTNDNINILLKNGSLSDIAQASDISNVSALSKPVKKYFLCYPKECRR